MEHESYTRSERYRIINETVKGLQYRNRRDEPEVPGGTMLADELNLFELLCEDLHERLVRASYYGDPRPLAEAINTFRAERAARGLPRP